MAERDREKRGRKLLLTLLVVGVVGSLGNPCSTTPVTESGGADVEF